MRRAGVIISILLFWAAMTGWFVMHEVMPGFLPSTSSGYRGLLSGSYLIVDNWMKISIGDRKIGYSHTSIDTDDEDPVNRYRIYNETELDVTVMENALHVGVTADIALDTMYHLQHFTFMMSSRDYKMRVTGTRKTGEMFDVSIRTGDSISRMSIEIPDDAVIYSPMMTLQLKQLKPGQTIRVKTFDPLSLGTTEVVVEALRKETLQHQGVAAETTVLSVESQGVEVLTWIDAEGVILRQETPFGWSLDACNAREAMAVDKEAGDSRDLLLALAVPVSKPIPESRAREPLRLRLKGAPFDRADLTSPRQEVKELSDESAVITLRPDNLPAESPAVSDLPAGLEEFLASSPYVQANDPKLIQQAGKIIGTETNSLKAVLLIYEWVHKNVRKEPAISVPSALAVLEVMSGDCNEHTYLFVGLARAAGLPAKILVGVTYNKGAFFYHAWPAVYVGRWLEMDPTLGQPAVDARHIKLLEGELNDQMKLMVFIGKLSIEVLDD